MKHRIAVFASGYGSNFEAIYNAAVTGKIDAEVVLFVCDKPGARSASLAREYGIESFVFSPKDYSGKAAYEQEIVSRCRQADVELICLAGYMRIVGPTLLDVYRDKIINLHPALLPSFKGENAIEQALSAGVKVFGATIHYVDETLDGGKIIAQKAFEYYGSDLDEVTAEVHKVEHILYIETINRILNK